MSIKSLSDYQIRCILFIWHDIEFNKNINYDSFYENMRTSKVQLKRVVPQKPYCFKEYVILYNHCMMEGNFEVFFSPRKTIFPKGLARKKNDFSWGFNIHVSPTVMQLTFYYTKQHIIIENTFTPKSFSTFLKAIKS